MNGGLVTTPTQRPAKKALTATKIEIGSKTGSVSSAQEPGNYTVTPTARNSEGERKVESTVIVMYKLVLPKMGR